MTKARSSSRSSSNTKVNKTAKTKNSITKSKTKRTLISLKKTQTSKPKNKITVVKKTRKSSQTRKKDEIAVRKTRPQQTDILDVQDKIREKSSIKKNRSVEPNDEKRSRFRKKLTPTKGGKVSVKNENIVFLKPDRSRKGVSRARSRSSEKEKKNRGRQRKNKGKEISTEKEEHIEQLKEKGEIKIDDIHIKTKTIADIIRSSKGIVVDIRKRSRKINRKKKDEKDDKKKEESSGFKREKSKDNKPKKQKEQKVKNDKEDNSTASSTSIY